MFIRPSFLRFLLVLAIAAAPTWAPAEDASQPVAAEKTPADAANADDIAAWIKQLDADEFAAREEATEKLAAAGSAALDALGQAAAGDNPEVTVRAFSILKQHLGGKDEALKASAKAALDQLAQADNAEAARRAKGILEAADKAAQPQQPQIPGIGGIRIAGGGAIRIHVGAIGGAKGDRRITVKSVDGNKEIEVQEGGRTVKIEESAKGNIKMQVTEKRDGKEETKKYEADSADDLKKKDPEAHKIYEKYSQGGGIGIGIIEVKPLRIGPGGALPLPIAPRVFPAPRLEKDDAAHAAAVEAMIERLEKAVKQLEANGADPAALKRHIERLHEQQKELQPPVAEEKPMLEAPQAEAPAVEAPE